MRNFKDSEQAFRKAITLDERYSDAYFNLGVLYLDSPVPDLEPVARLQKSIETLQKYKEVAGGRMAKNDPVDKYIAEAKKAIETEKAKQELMRESQMQGGEENGAQPVPES
jgi:tetratricopeptide (TPR) repeat protein